MVRDEVVVTLGDSEGASSCVHDSKVSVFSVCSICFYSVYTLLWICDGFNSQDYEDYAD